MSVRTSFEKEAKCNSEMTFSMELLHPRLPAEKATKLIYDDTYMTLCASAGFCLSSKRDIVKEFDMEGGGGRQNSFLNSEQRYF